MLHYKKYWKEVPSLNLQIFRPVTMATAYKFTVPCVAKDWKPVFSK